jgi:hypothetical protein
VRTGKGKISESAKRHGFRFRVSYRTTLHGAAKSKEVVFKYYDLRSALKSYKSILLGLYLSKEVESFVICINRYKDEPWSYAIHKEAND